LLLLSEQFSIELDGLWILIVDAVFFEGLALGQFHHILHQRNFPLEFAFVLARFLHKLYGYAVVRH